MTVQNRKSSQIRSYRPQTNQKNGRLGTPGTVYLSGNVLKWIAMIAMFIDHSAVVLIENRFLGGQTAGVDYALALAQPGPWWKLDLVMRLIGRLAFPIFCFLLVEGFVHTRSVKDYAMRLALLACVSEIPFDLAIFGKAFYWDYQNVAFTLLLGIGAMSAWKKCEGKSVFQVLSAGGFCLMAMMVDCDYGAFGVFLIVLLYALRENRRWQAIFGALSVLWENSAPLAFILIYFYNGERGKANWKYLFYTFYPLHLLILAGIARILG